jgi:hypothetical protein
MTTEVQQDDEVLGRRLQPANQLPQLILRQPPEARLFAFVLQFTTRPAVDLFPQVQLKRELLRRVKCTSQVILEGHSVQQVGGGGVVADRSCAAMQGAKAHI